MPNPIIPLPIFPNVAQLPGVPQLVRASQAIGTIQLAVGAVQQLLGAAASTPPTWGIFDSKGNLAIQPDSFLDFDNSNDWNLPTFPLQDGEFSNYNKVKLPGETSIKISKGGSLQDRKNLLNKIAQIAGDTNLYTILTPEVSYLSVNIRRYTIRRMGREGAFFFADLEIYFRAIQQTTSQYSSTDANTANAINPVALPPVNLGTQFPQVSVLPSVQSAVNTALANVPH
jgi:hypothetical protein